jgi:hypothetical protein
VPKELEGRLLQFRSTIGAILAGRVCPRCLGVVKQTGADAGVWMPGGERLHHRCLERRK